MFAEPSLVASVSAKPVALTLTAASNTLSVVAARNRTNMQLAKGEGSQVAVIESKKVAESNASSGVKHHTTWYSPSVKTFMSVEVKGSAVSIIPPKTDQKTEISTFQLPDEVTAKEVSFIMASGSKLIVVTSTGSILTTAIVTEDKEKKAHWKNSPLSLEEGGEVMHSLVSGSTAAMIVQGNKQWQFVSLDVDSPISTPKVFASADLAANDETVTAVSFDETTSTFVLATSHGLYVSTGAAPSPAFVAHQRKFLDVVSTQGSKAIVAVVAEGSANHLILEEWDLAAVAESKELPMTSAVRTIVDKKMFIASGAKEANLVQNGVLLAYNGDTNVIVFSVARDLYAAQIPGGKKKKEVKQVSALEAGFLAMKLKAQDNASAAGPATASGTTPAAEVVNAVLSAVAPGASTPGASQSKTPAKGKKPQAASATTLKSGDVIRDQLFISADGQSHQVVDLLAAAAKKATKANPLELHRLLAEYFRQAAGPCWNSVCLALKALVVANAADLPNQFAHVAAALRATTLRDQPKAAVKAAFSNVQEAAKAADALYLLTLFALDSADFAVVMIAVPVLDAILATQYKNSIIEKELGFPLVEKMHHCLTVVSSWAMSEPGVYIGQLSVSCGPESAAKKEPSIVPNSAYRVKTSHEAKVTREMIAYKPL